MGASAPVVASAPTHSGVISPPASTSEASAGQVASSTVISQTIEAGPHLADQVVSVVQPFQLGAAGEHTVVLQFYPEGLGALRAQVVFSDGTLAVQLFASTDAGHAAMSAAMPHLHELLSADGLGGSTVELHYAPTSQPGTDQPGGQAGRQGLGSETGSGSGESTSQRAARASAAELAIVGTHVVDLEL